MHFQKINKCFSFFYFTAVFECELKLNKQQQQQKKQTLSQ